MKIVSLLTLGLIFSFSIFAMDPPEKRETINLYEATKKKLESQGNPAALDAILQEINSQLDLQMAEIGRSGKKSFTEIDALLANSDFGAAENQAKFEKLFRETEQSIEESRKVKK